MKTEQQALNRFSAIGPDPFLARFFQPIKYLVITLFLLMGYQVTNGQVRAKADRVVTSSAFTIPDGDYMREFERIQIEQFGVKVTNLSGHRIGCSPAMPPASSGFCWNPVTGFRETLRATLTKYFVETGHSDDVYTGSDGKLYRQGEYDWNFELETAASHREKFDADEIFGEVTPPENFYDNIWFPLKNSSRPSLLLNNVLCIYGPYVKDKGNDSQPEMHPIDAIWWQLTEPGANQVRIMLLQDAAKGRFREEGMYHKESCDDNFTGWKPWIQYPQIEEVKIPFSYDPAEGKFTQVAITVQDAWDITTDLQPDLRDSDDGTQHQLLLGTNQNQNANVRKPILVRVTEEEGKANRQIAVQFMDLTRDAQGIIRGYIQLLVALGDKENMHEGIIVFTLTSDKVAQNAGPGPVISKDR